jgi:hypothetical protein
MIEMDQSVIVHDAGDTVKASVSAINIKSGSKRIPVFGAPSRLDLGAGALFENRFAFRCLRPEIYEDTGKHRMLGLCSSNLPTARWLSQARLKGRKHSINLRETPAGRDVVRRCREPTLTTRGISIDGGALAQLRYAGQNKCWGLSDVHGKFLSLICDQHVRPGTAG